MKNLLILIVAIALFLHFYPQPKVTEFYNEQKAALIEAFTEFSDTKIQLKADKIFTDLQPKLDRFSANEITYLKELTSSRDKVKAFYQNFCEKNVNHPQFYSANQETVCNAIGQYKSML